MPARFTRHEPFLSRAAGTVLGPRWRPASRSAPPVTPDGPRHGAGRRASHPKVPPVSCCSLTTASPAVLFRCVPGLRRRMRRKPGQCPPIPAGVRRGDFATHAIGGGAASQQLSGRHSAPTAASRPPGPDLSLRQHRRSPTRRSNTDHGRLATRPAATLTSPAGRLGPPDSRSHQYPPPRVHEP